MFWSYLKCWSSFDVEKKCPCSSCLNKPTRHLKKPGLRINAESMPKLGWDQRKSGSINLPTNKVGPLASGETKKTPTTFTEQFPQGSPLSCKHDWPRRTLVITSRHVACCCLFLVVVCFVLLLVVILVAVVVIVCWFACCSSSLGEGACQPSLLALLGQPISRHPPSQSHRWLPEAAQRNSKQSYIYIQYT